MLCIKKTQLKPWGIYKRIIKKLVRDERGEMVGTIGWMAIIATFLVVIHGLISGWLPGFVTRIFSRLDTLV